MPTRPETPAPNKAGGAALHAVHSERLKAVMGSLNTLAFERLPQELDTSNRQRAELKRAAAVAGEMAQSTEQIQSMAETMNLPADEQKVFLTLAKRMRSQVQTLDGQANRGEIRGAQATLQELSSTCIACHALFRESPFSENNSQP